jgi:hypothetical protein
MMEASNFIDCYEIMEISPNADLGTIERMFRYLAQRYHPDNQDTGDRLRFDAVMAAYGTIFSIKTIRPPVRNWPRKPATVKASDGMPIFRTSCSRFFMSNVDKTSEIRVSAVAYLDAR